MYSETSGTVSMKHFLIALFSLVPFSLRAQMFSCPSGQADVMKYFVMSQERRADHFLDGKPNPIYTVLSPDSDFANLGYWFWLKSPKAHGFDVKSFDAKYVYMRSTELTWKDNTSFKRFEHDLPIAQRLCRRRPARPRDQGFEYPVRLLLFLPTVQIEQRGYSGE
jgi:hypothetical protein